MERDRDDQRRGVAHALAASLFALAFVIIAYATRRRAGYGVAALVATDPFALYQSTGSTMITLPKVALLAVFAGLVWRGANWNPLRDRHARLLLGAALAIVATTALSIHAADYHGPAIRETFKAVEYLAIFAVALCAYAADPDERVALVAIVATTIAVSVAALAQTVLGSPSVISLDRVAVPRVAGPIEGPNQLSGYLGIALPVILAAGLRIRAFSLAAITCALALAACADVLTFSRSGIVTGAIAVGVVAIIARPRLLDPRLFALAGGAGAGFLIEAALISQIGPAIAQLWAALLSHMNSASPRAWGAVSRTWAAAISHMTTLQEAPNPGGVGTRSQLWRAAITLWERHPLLGIGAGNFELEIGRVGPKGIRTHANNGYLQALCEGGLPLVAATLGQAFASIRSFWGRTLTCPFALGALAASIGLVLHLSLIYI